MAYYSDGPQNPSITCAVSLRFISLLYLLVCVFMSVCVCKCVYVYTMCMYVCVCMCMCVSASLCGSLVCCTCRMSSCCQSVS